MEQARLKRIDRSQSYWGQVDIENLIGPEHVARAIWELSGTLDLGAFLHDNKSVEGRAGAERTDPRLLVSVWVYGLTRGIGAARELARRMSEEAGLRWLSGDEEVNYHTLSDFRVAHGAALDQVLSQVLAALSQAGLVKLEQLTVDGTKIQAQASGASFRREPTLRERLAQAEAVVEQLQQEACDEPARTKRQAAQQRAARERQARLQQALEEVQTIGRSKPASQREPARASASEPEARVMKQGDGGFAPAYNVQSVTDAAHKIVVSVEVTAQANDQHQLLPALQRIEPLQPAAQVIVDGGYLTEHNIAEAVKTGVELIGPAQQREAKRAHNQQQSLARAGIQAEFGPQAFRVLENGAALECPAGRRLKLLSKAAGHDQYRADAKDCARCSHRAQCCPHSGQRSVKIKRPSPVVESFHQRMQQDSCRQLYKLRGAVAEFPHAWWKEKFRLRKFHVRGLKKVRMEMKWAALTYNIQQWIRLLWRPALRAGVA
jgi:transposase